METVCNYLGIGETALYQAAIGGAQIHTYHLNLHPARVAANASSYRCFAFTLNDIVYSVILQIHNRCGKATFVDFMGLFQICWCLFPIWLDSMKLSH